MKAISCLLFVVLISFTGKAAADFDYRGQVFIKKTGLDDGNYAELETRLIFTGEKSTTRFASNSLLEDTSFPPPGFKVVDSFFTVIGDLQFVRVIVKERDNAVRQIVCDKGYGVGQLNIPGTKTFTCTNFLGPGNSNKWVVKIRVIISFKRAASA